MVVKIATNIVRSNDHLPNTNPILRRIKNKDHGRIAIKVISMCYPTQSWKIEYINILYSFDSKCTILKAKMDICS